MTQKYSWAGMALAFLTVTACASHYRLTGVERTRIVVDKRFDAAPDQEAAAFLKPYAQQVDSIMRPVVGTLARNMFAHRPESELSNLLADIMVWGGKDFGEHPDLGVYNMGGIRAGLSKGKITYGNVLDVAPFENKICFVTLTGEALLELFRNMAATGGEGVSHGVALVFRDKQLESATLHGKPIDKAADYRVATIDYLVQGNDHLSAFKKGTALLSPQTVENNTRFIIMNYFKEMERQGKAVDSRIEGRIVVCQ